jgi:hypothetical protein
MAAPVSSTAELYQAGVAVGLAVVLVAARTGTMPSVFM